jgi:hypothetical protein
MEENQKNVKILEHKDTYCIVQADINKLIKPCFVSSYK